MCLYGGFNITLKHQWFYFITGVINFVSYRNFFFFDVHLTFTFKISLISLLCPVS